MDTSWQLDWQDTVLLIDPWLVGSEVDGFGWFNEQWHTTPPVPIDKLGSYHGLVVSQSYSDHCHEQTLDLLPEATIYSTPKATKRLTKAMADRLQTLPDFEENEWQQIGNLEVAYLDPGRKMDPVYYGIVIRHGEDVVLYTPHGFEPSARQTELLGGYNICLLI